MSSDETIGELSRRLGRFEDRHAQEMAAAEARCNHRASMHVDSALYVAQRETLMTQVADLKADLKTHEGETEREFKATNDRLTWAFRASLTGVAFPILVGVAMLIITTVGR